MRYFSILGGVLGAALFLSVPAHAQVQRVLGLDVSAWQTDMTEVEWATLKRPTNQQVGGVSGDGRDFVFIRASRGGTTGVHPSGGPGGGGAPSTLSQRYDDPYFIQNITRATKAGLFAGSYHFGRMDVIASTPNANGIPNNGTDEANHFLEMAGPWMRPGYLPPVFDLEAGIAERTGAELAQFAIDFSNRILAVKGIRPAVYIGGNYTNEIANESNDALENELAAAYPTLWNARWPNQTDPNSIDVQNTHPKDTYANFYGPWDNGGVTHPWSFWQYASTMRLNGNNLMGSNTDVNVAQGGIEFVKDKLVPALWITDNSGEWTDLGKWNSGVAETQPVQGPGQPARIGGSWTTGTTLSPAARPEPRLPGEDDAPRGVDGQNDTVILDRPNANITVTLSSGAHNIRKLYAREALDIAGGTLNINYIPSSDSTPIAAQFSAAVSLSGSGTLSVHTLQVDATRTFTVGGGNLSFNKINLMPHVSTPAKILMNGDMNVTPLANATATIANGAGGGTSGRVDLGGANREFNVGDGSSDVDLSISVPIINGGLTKAGAGTLAMSGANTYTGDTAVEAGRLRLSSPVLANAADMYLTTGSLLDLTFPSGTPDMIDSLFIDGVSKEAGLWGAVGSGAPFTSPLITGTGRLQVTTFIAPPAPIPGDFNGDDTVDAADLAFWQTGYGMESGAGVGDGDADGDFDVDAADLMVWQQNLGMSQAVAAAAAVPEPHAGVLMLLAAGALLRRRAVR